ncbi:MAG: hypothetical protein KDK99_15735 [Verrucomicrobiales bacterium]|nr:hypothetical protein [Verrucomicrobiales bacterium]
MARLPEGLRAGGAELWAARGRREEAGCFEAFRQAAFAKPEWVLEAADFLVHCFEGREPVLAGWTGIGELMQELSSGGAMLTLTVVTEWVMGGERRRLLPFADAVLASRAHLTAEPTLDVMLALASTLAFLRPARARDLLAHVEACRRDGVAVDRAAHAEAVWRVACGQVVAAGEEEVRSFWDQRLSRGSEDGGWDQAEEQRALRDLAMWWREEEPAAARFRAVLPADWDARRDRWAGPRSGSEALGEERVAESRQVENEDVDSDVVDEEGPRHWVMAAGSWWQGFLVGGLTGVVIAALVFMVFEWNAARHRSQAVSEVEPGERPVSPQAAREVERLEEELRFLGNVESLREVSWDKASRMLMGETPDLPYDSRLYAELLVLLHWAPSRDPITRFHVAELLLRRAPTGDLVTLWEEVAEANEEMRPAIAHAAREALAMVTASWTDELRERLGRLAELSQEEPE